MVLCKSIEHNIESDMETVFFVGRTFDYQIQESLLVCTGFYHTYNVRFLILLKVGQV